MVWRLPLLFVMAVLVLLPGCTKEKSEKVPDQLLGKWIEETPESKNASPEARAAGMAYEFKPNGTVVMSCGPMQQSKSYQIKDGKLIIEGGEPQTLKELTAKRLVIGDEPAQMVFTR